MKLKTLKEIPGVEQYYGETLRKEAIKWIKFIKQDSKEMHKDSEGKFYHNGQIDILKVFFNISEEDLK